MHLLDIGIKFALIKTSKSIDADASKSGTPFQAVFCACKQSVSLHNLDCQCSPMILVHQVIVFTVWLYSLWLCLLSELFIFYISHSRAACRMTFHS